MARSRSANASVMPPEVLACASARPTSAAERSVRDAALLSMMEVQAAISLSGGALLPGTQSTGVPPAAAGPAAVSRRPSPNKPDSSEKRGVKGKRTGWDLPYMAGSSESDIFPLSRPSRIRFSLHKLTLIPVGPQKMLQTVPHELQQVVAGFAEIRVAAGDEVILLALQGLPLARRLGLAHDADVHRMDLAVEIGEFRIGADRLLRRPARRRAIEARLARDRHQRAQPLQLPRQLPVIAARELMVRLELDRGAEVGERLRPVALLPPELATRIEEIGLISLEPDGGIVVGDGAPHVRLARMGAAARHQRFETVGFCGFLMINQRAAVADDPVIVAGRYRGHAGRRVDLGNGAGVGSG